MTDTISFEYTNDRDGGRIAVSVNMPDHAVMARERFQGLFRDCGHYISFNTAHFNPPRLTFLMSDGEFTYEIKDDGGRFLLCTKVKERRK